MIGIVLVSHSRALGEALLNLVRQVASADVQIAVAAGVGADRQEFGTDAVEIMDAIQQVFSADGVLVLMDLGSAILSAEMARDLLPPEISEKVRFCAAPIVEGAMAAAVQAGLGASIDAVFQEASAALFPKQEQLGQLPVQAGPALQPEPAAAGGETITLTLLNLHGLHARPAARFVQAASSFQADVWVRNLTTGKGPVSARSLNAVATLGAVGGHQIEIQASGPQAAQALEMLQRMVAEAFGEALLDAAAGQEQAVVSPAPPAETPEGALGATPVSEGFALGPLYRYQPQPPPISDEPAGDVAAEIARLKRALADAAEGIRQEKKRLQTTLSPDQAAIFDAHLLIAQDPDLFAAAQKRIQTQAENAARAWHTVIEATAESYLALPDAYLRQRAIDVQDVGRQVLFALAGKSAEKIALPGPVVLFAQDITPTETSQLDMDQVLALITVGGGPTSHSAILARALGIPAVSGASLALNALPAGTQIGLDGGSGQIWVAPDAARQADLQARRQAWIERKEALLKTSQALALTRDGQRIEVVANAGSLADAQSALRNGAEGIGLLRTEFLFLTRQSPPSEDEQTLVLQQIGAAMGARPVIVRTLDAGGDKELPYAGLPDDANPFLGVRAIRVSLQKPELFRAQLRAILRAGADANLRIMFPMVANLDEVLAAKTWLANMHAELLAEGVAHAWPISTGIMIEVPSAALLSDVLAPHVDFFSIGTNDLTQYTLAAERGNPALAHLADALHPAVLRLIGQVTRSAKAHGRWVGVCGELAGDPAAAAALVGLGVTELSLTPAGIPRIKHLLARLEMPAADALAQQLLAADSASRARQIAQDFLKTLEEPAA